MPFAPTLARAQRLLKLFGVAGLLVSGAAYAQSVSNPGFESGTLAPWTAAISGDANATVAPAQGLITPHSGSYFGYGYDNLGVGRISQPVATVAGASYTVSAWVSTTDGSGVNEAWVRLGTSSPAVSCSLSQNVWTLCTGTFAASAASEPLELQFLTVPGSGVVTFDDVTVAQASGPSAVTPVPTLNEWALMLLAAGAAALGAGRLRRRN